MWCAPVVFNKFHHILVPSVDRLPAHPEVNNEVPVSDSVSVTPNSWHMLRSRPRKTEEEAWEFGKRVHDALDEDFRLGDVPLYGHYVSRVVKVDDMFELRMIYVIVSEQLADRMRDGVVFSSSLMSTQDYDDPASRGQWALDMMRGLNAPESEKAKWDHAVPSVQIRKMLVPREMRKFVV